jgi:type I restriction enzyme S subunit
MAELDTIDIESKHLKMVRSVFARHLPYKQVWAYGSRVKWTAGHASDLDCVVFVATDSEVANAKEAFDESDIPFEVQLLNWETIPDDFKNNIKEQYFVLQKIGSWKEYRLADFADINPTERLPKGTIAKKIAMELIQPFTKKILSYSKEEYKGGMKFKNSDTIMARITPSLENGKTSYVDILDKDEIGFGSTEFIIFREKQNISDRHFIYYLITSSTIRNAAIKSMTGSSGRQRVQIDVIREHLFDAPPLLEQKAIASVLSSLDDKIDLLHRQNQTLESIAKTLFRQWFIEEAQDDWEDKPLDTIANYLNGLACQKYLPKNDIDKLPVLKIKDLRSGLSEASDWAASDVAKEYIIKNGDVIFSWSGSLLVKIWDGKICILNQHLFKVTSNQYPKWFIYLWTNHHLRKFTAIAKSKATTMGHITKGDLASSMVVIPSDTEIKDMSKTMSPIIDKIIFNNTQISKLESLHDTLLPKLMSGDVRVEYEVAA